MTSRDDEVHEALVARLRGLGTAVDDAPDPAFRAATRTRLVAMAAVRSPEPARRGLAARLLAGRAPDRPAAPRRTRLVAGLAGASLAVGALGSLVALSTDARPGDPLYGLKRGTEQTRLALASDDSRGLTLLGFATTRLDELQELVDGQGAALPAAGPAAGAPTGQDVLAAGGDADLVRSLLETMDRQTTEGTYWLATAAVQGRDPGSFDVLDSWAAGQSAGLSSLSPAVPEQARPALDSAVALLADVAARGQALQDALDCAAGPAVAGTDDLGPLPAACAGPGTPGTVAATTVAPAAPSSGEPAAPSSATVPGDPAVPTAGSAPGSAGTAGAPAPTTPRGTGPATTPVVPSPTTTTRPPSGGGPLVSVPPLLPTGSGGSSTPATTAPTTTKPPLVDLPLPVCIGRLVC